MKHREKSAEKEFRLKEEQLHMKRLAELEDRYAREEERRRDYKKQVDDYHKILGEERLDLSKRQKAEIARDQILREAEVVRKIGEEEKVRKQQAMASYNNDLKNQMEGNARTYIHNDLVDDAEYQKHSGIIFGEYQHPSKEEQFAILNRQVENKTRHNHKLQAVDNAVKDGDWLARKDLIDKWNYNYIHDHRRKNLEPRDTKQLNELKDQAIRENARKRREDEKQRMNDQNLINNLVQNERQQKMEEVERNQIKKEILAHAYENQKREKQVKNEIERVNAEREAKGTSFMDGTQNRFGNANYDYRHDIEDNQNRKAHERYNEKVQDAHLVDNLDKFDRDIIQKERKHKREVVTKMNQEYNITKERLEHERQMERDAKLNVRPRVYGED